MSEDQVEFDFSEISVEAHDATNRARGYDIEHEIAEEWGLPLGKTVEVWVRNPERLLYGRLELAEIPRTLDRRQVLQLRIKGDRFSSREISSWLLV